MDIHRVALGLICPIYDAADDESLWPEALDRLSAAMQARGAILGVQSDGGGPGSHFIGVGSCCGAASVGPEYLARFAEEDPLNRALRQQPPLVPSLTHEIVPPEQFFETEVYREVYARLGNAYGIGMVLVQERRFFSGVTLFRGRDDTPFEDDCVELLELVGPHLQRAFQLHRRFAEVAGRWDAAGEVLDRLPMGVVLLDDDRRLVFANKEASSILQARDSGVAASDDRLVADRSDDAQALKRLIDGALDTSAGIVAEPGGALHLRNGGGASLAVLVTPLRNGARWPGQRQPKVALFISDPNLAPEVPSDVLMRLYGLTPSEAAVAARLVGGSSLIEAAKALFITENTARRHLTHIFAKTGTSRQPQLVRLLSTGPAALRV